MQNFIFILSPIIFATACLAASEGVENLKNLKLDCARITGIEKIEAGSEIDGGRRLNRYGNRQSGSPAAF